MSAGFCLGGVDGGLGPAPQTRASPGRRLTWCSTVLRLMYRRSAISGLVSPCPSSSRTSASRFVRRPESGATSAADCEPSDRISAATASAWRAAGSRSKPSRAARASTRATLGCSLAKAPASSKRAWASSSGVRASANPESASRRQPHGSPSSRPGTGVLGPTRQLPEGTARGAERTAAPACRPPLRPRRGRPPGELGVDERRPQGAAATPVGSTSRQRASEDVDGQVWLASLQVGDGQRSGRFDVAIEAPQELLGLLEAALADPQLGQADERARDAASCGRDPRAARRRSAPRRLHPSVLPRSATLRSASGRTRRRPEGCAALRCPRRPGSTDRLGRHRGRTRRRQTAGRRSPRRS